MKDIADALQQGVDIDASDQQYQSMKLTEGLQSLVSQLDNLNLQVGAMTGADPDDRSYAWLVTHRIAREVLTIHENFANAVSDATAREYLIGSNNPQVSRVTDLADPEYFKTNVQAFKDSVYFTSVELAKKNGLNVFWKASKDYADKQLQNLAGVAPKVAADLKQTFGERLDNLLTSWSAAKSEDDRYKLGWQLIMTIRTFRRRTEDIFSTTNLVNGPLHIFLKKVYNCLADRVLEQLQATA